jgi:DNA processing protein
LKYSSKKSISRNEDDRFSLYDYLGLMSIPGIGEVRFRRLLKHFGSPAAVFDAGLDQLSEVESIGINEARSIKAGYRRDKIEQLIENLEKNEINIVTIDSDIYPVNLKQIYDPPPLLYYKGDISICSDSVIAIVGSRKASAYGKSMAERLTMELVEMGFMIVSGFALGIDTIVHRTALENGGKTAAVLGCGLDIVYPPENRSLFDELIRSGCIISEFTPGTRPEPHNFPKRNRVLSGLASGVVVVEAGQKSGALITARHALEQGREVFAVPGQANSSGSDGTNNLIRQGARLTTKGEDIRSELETQLETPPISKSERKSPENLTDDQKLIYLNLDNNGKHIDKISNATGMDVSGLLGNLLEMELSGYVRALPGKRYARR